MIIFGNLFGVQLSSRLRTLQPTQICRFSSTKSEMCEFYSGKNIFITGVTGFVGKALLEKMLATFPDIGHVYVLIRGKRNVSFNDRLNKLRKEPIFTKYKRVNVSNMSKVIGIEGHLGNNGLQISEQDRCTLSEKVNVVFHVAATVRFNEPLDIAMKNIFIGTKSILSLANDMRHLSSFVYVSTAYSNCHKSTADEIVYDMKTDGDSVLSLYENHSKEEVEKMVWEKYFDGRPNTYTFAKGLTENYIRKYYSHLPVTIARPSVIAGALIEPERGYCDSPSACSYGIIYQALGICRYQPLKEKATIDIIPIDITVNSLLIVAREVAMQNLPVTSVYNVSSESHWHLTHKQLADSKLNAIMRAPSAAALRPVAHRTTEMSNFEQFVVNYFSELPFAIVMDTIAKIRGRNSRMLKLTRAVQSTRDDQRVFFQNSYFFPRKNMDSAIARLSEEDQKLFPAYPIVNDNDEYFYDYWMSLRELILGEKKETVDTAQRLQKRLSLQSKALFLGAAATSAVISALYVF